MSIKKLTRLITPTNILDCLRPICLPEISSLEAVLNFSSHDYMYFCAREDLSGYHSFASDLKTHMLNARRYQAELNRRNIRR